MNIRKLNKQLQKFTEDYNLGRLVPGQFVVFKNSEMTGQIAKILEDVEEGYKVQVIGRYNREGLLSDILEEPYEDTLISHLCTYEILDREIENLERKQVEKPIADNSKDKSGSKKTRKVTKVGRNDPCPCGSGKKYKQCHGK